MSLTHSEEVAFRRAVASEIIDDVIVLLNLGVDINARDENPHGRYTVLQSIGKK